LEVVVHDIRPDVIHVSSIICIRSGRKGQVMSKYKVSFTILHGKIYSV
jgi:hypothetical protein